MEPGCCSPRAPQSRALTVLVGSGTGTGTGEGLAYPFLYGRGARTHLLSAVSFPLRPWGPVWFSMLTGTMGAGFRKGWERYPSPPVAQGPSPAWKNPQLFPPSCRVPLGMGLGGERRSWMKSKGKHMLGPHPPKQEVGWGHCTLHPMTSSCFWQSCFLTPNFCPQPWGSATHLSAPDCPGMVPALSPCPLLGQPTGAAWKNPIRPACLWGVESGRGGGGPGWDGRWRAHGHPVVSPAPDATGQTQETL